MTAHKKDDLVFIDDILEAVEKITRFCKGIDKKDFIVNDLLHDAVVRNLEIIGEASSRLSASFKNEHKERLNGQKYL